MFFDIDVNTFRESLKVLGRTVDRAPGIPIYAGVKIVVSNNDLIMYTTNGSGAIKYSCQCITAEDGTVLAPYRILCACVSAMPDGVIRFEVSDNLIRLSSAGISFKMKVMLGENDFPLFPKLGDGYAMDLPFEESKKLIMKVAPFASKDFQRPELQCVKVDINDDILVLSATDAYRIMLGKLQLKQRVAEKFECIIPAKFLLSLQRVVSPDDKLTIGQNEKLVFVECGGFVFAHSKVAGKFPNLENLVPKFEEISTIQTLPFVSALARQTVIPETIHRVLIEFDNNFICFKTVESDSVVKEKIDFVGSAMEPAVFNADWLLQGLRTYDDESVMYKNIGVGKPCAVSNEDETLIYLLLPINLA